MQKIIIFSSSIIFTMSCGNPKVNPDRDKIDSSSIFCTYNSRPMEIIGGSSLSLLKDSTYAYSWSMCVANGVDSGKFKYDHDTITFTSSIASRVDTSNHGFNEITPITGNKYLLRSGRMFTWRYKGGEFDTTVFMLSEYSIVTTHDILGKNGDGYADLYDGHSQWTERGNFRNYKLYDGMKYRYDDSGLKLIEVYKSGVKVRDSTLR